MKNLTPILITVLLLGGCSSAPSSTTSNTTGVSSTSATPRATASSVSPEHQALAEKLSGQAKDGKFEYKVLNDPANGPAFLILADKDPKLAAAALEAMSLTYTHYEPDKKKNHPDEYYQSVVLRHLDAQDGPTLYFAIKAAGALMGAKPQRPVVDKLVQIVLNHPKTGARYEAMESLFLMKDFLADKDIAEAFLATLKAEPALQSSALFRFRSNAYSLPNKSAVHQAAYELTKSKDEGVRGRAWQVVAETVDTKDKAKLAEELTGALKDKSPFVRSVAADCLSLVAKQKGVAALMPLLSDKTSNTYEIEFQNLRGHKETVHHDGSPWSRVDDAALYAIQSATGMMDEEKKFKYGKIDHTKVDADIAAQIKACQSWFEKTKSSLK